MNVIVTVDHHFIRTPDGKVWVKNIHDQKFWERYTNVFEQVYVICRLQESSSNDSIEGYLLSSTNNVHFCGVPDFVGPKDMLKKKMSITKAIKLHLKEIGEDAAVVLRLPSTIGFMLYKFVKNRPYCVEVVANPMTAYTKKGSFMHSFISKKYTHDLKKICMRAQGVSYVTKYELQKYFHTKGFTEHYSSIDLNKNFFYERQKDSVLSKQNPKKIIIVSRIDSEKKGHETLLLALSDLKKKAVPFECEIVGDGKMRVHYQQFAKECGLNDQDVSFIGEVAEKERIRALLMAADLFVYPTHSEGLPRVLIEAMSCSLPIISSPVGGIPELIDEEYLIDYNSVEKYGDMIQTLLDNNSLLYKLGNENYHRAKNYEEQVLNSRREAFYKNVFDI